MFLDMNVRSTDLAAYVLLVGSVLVGVLLWASLPDRMAIHFGTGGQPDDFVAQSLAVALAPAIGLVGVLVTRYAPTWARRTQSPLVERATVLFVASVVAYAQGFVYAWNLGYRLTSTVFVLVPVLLAAGAFVAYTRTRDGTPS